MHRLPLSLQICLAAAASFVALCALGRRALGAALPPRLAAAAVRAAAALFLAATCLLALSRSAALVVNYGAPMRLYSALPVVGGWVAAGSEAGMVQLARCRALPSSAVHQPVTRCCCISAPPSHPAGGRPGASHRGVRRRRVAPLPLFFLPAGDAVPPAVHQIGVHRPAATAL